MIIYIRTMRKKDEIKQDALFRATIKLVNKIGFASSSVAKIAKEAKISPATIYIYYKNKEDLLVSTYMDIKKSYMSAMLQDFDETLPMYEIFKKLWINMFDYVHRNTADFLFTEQFANSPFMELVDENEYEQLFAPVLKVFERGIERKILKDVSFELLSAFAYYPVLTIAKSSHGKILHGKDSIETAFEMAWDAIKL